MTRFFHEKVLEFIRLLRQREIAELRKSDVKFVIAEHFGDDRHKISFILKHLQRIGFFRDKGVGTLRLDYSVEEEYRKDRLFFI